MGLLAQDDDLVEARPPRAGYCLGKFLDTWTPTPPLLAGYEGMKRPEKTIPEQGKVRLSEAVERLVRLYEATDTKDAAAKWREELEARKPQTPRK